jgi:molecular chaperone IbpA
MSNQLRFNTTELNRAFVGFEQLFTQLETRFNNPPRDTYPPYNIIKISDTEYQIEVAVAGFSKDELTVKLDDGILTISGKKHAPDDAASFTHQGLARRPFEKLFQLSDYMVVKSATAKDGILTVTTERIIPEEKKPRYIDIE